MKPSKWASALSVGLLSTALIGLTGCASYRASTLSNLSTKVFNKQEQLKNDVFLVTKDFNEEDCERYLDRNVIKEGYQPVQVYIQNDTDNSYAFDLNNMNQTIASAEEVANCVHTFTQARAFGYGVGAFFIWPLAIPAVVDGIKSSHANDQLDRDFDSKVAKNQIIQPYSAMNVLIFIPAGTYQEPVEVGLIDQFTGEIKTIRPMATI